MKNNVECNLRFCYENDSGECNCYDCDDEVDLAPNEDSCVFYNDRYRDQEKLLFLNKELMEEAFDRYEESVQVSRFDEDTLEVIYRRFKTDKGYKRFFIQISSDDLKKFEIRISVDYEILFIDKNQQDFSEILLCK